MRLSALALALAFANEAAFADVKPLLRSQWPSTVAAAVPLIVATLTPAQRSIVMGTSRENLFLLQGEWGEDIAVLLGLNAGNTALVAAACGPDCKIEQSTLLLMEAAWEALQK